jgi:hypothetical protein
MSEKTSAMAVFYTTNKQGELSSTGTELLDRLKAAHPEVFTEWSSGHWCAKDAYLVFDTVYAHSWHTSVIAGADVVDHAAQVFDNMLNRLADTAYCAGLVPDFDAILYEAAFIGEESGEVDISITGEAGLLRVVHTAECVVAASEHPRATTLGQRDVPAVHVPDVSKS